MIDPGRDDIGTRLRRLEEAVNALAGSIATLNATVGGIAALQNRVAALEAHPVVFTGGGDPGGAAREGDAWLPA